jgi:hypothetical protein
MGLLKNTRSCPDGHSRNRSRFEKGGVDALGDRPLGAGGVREVTNHYLDWVLAVLEKRSSVI